MKRQAAIIASILQLGYSAMLVAIGVAGIFGARWELATVFGIDPSAWPPEAEPTMLNQYRFLKSVELGAGLFCFAYRSKILAGTRASAVFLAIVGLGVAARTLSWFIDGRPAAAFIAFLILEACVFAAVTLHLRLSHGQA
jgi:hypothetical protein